MNIEEYLRKDYVTSLMREGRRIDNRKLDEFREIKIEKGYSSEKAPGSAFINLGDTKVLVGISMGVGEPYPDRPTSGVMTTNVELRPIASPLFESGPPREKAIEIARVVDRGIRESGAIDLDKLYIEEDKVWIAFIDVHVLDDGGNILDAAGIGAISALLDTRLPKYEDGVVIRGEWEGKLPITCTPVPVTNVKIGSNLVVDPNLDEEYARETQLTVTTTDVINAMQKSGIGVFSSEEVDEAIETSFKKAKEIREIIEG
ncbi:MAG: RNA-binding protein [Candidatus Altiarchaeales archaeon ex4484_2]|nr:MAG: RNA-binding protein [Candidatus Altiarchaeales archaeon ex4484_2]